MSAPNCINPRCACVCHAHDEQLIAALRDCVRAINAMPKTKQAEDIQAECGMFSAVAKARAALAQ